MTAFQTAGVHNPNGWDRQLEERTGHKSLVRRIDCADLADALVPLVGEAELR